MNELTVADIQNDIEKIQQHSGDDEAMHSMEDSLHQNVLLAIAEGRCNDSAACARAALETLKMDFARWRA